MKIKRPRPALWGAVLLAGALGAGEWLGWPFLAQPLQHWVSGQLDRDLRFGDAAVPGFHVRFIGGIRLQAAQLQVAAPAWSTAPHMLRAQDLALQLRYTDLWRAYRGAPLRIHSLQARMLDAQIERLADGRASWQFQPSSTPATPNLPTPWPQFGTLALTQGALRYRDLPLAAEVDATLSLAPAPQGDASVLQVQASGRYQGKPLKIRLDSTALLASTAAARPTLPVAMHLDVTVGHAHLLFNGAAADALQPGSFAGRFSLQGPSLAAVGDPVGVTLPTTAAFATQGSIAKDGTTWQVVLDDATVGASRLRGAFTYTAGGAKPLLAGQLGGSRLLLADLGPAVGGATPADKATQPRGSGKVLPDRPFDLAALRAMDANVLIDIGEVDLHTQLLQPLKPLQTHLQLQAGVLRLDKLLARTADGQLQGSLALDGRTDTAVLTTDLRWDGVRLERWLQQTRTQGQPPYVSGQLQGRAVLTGRGRSTAEILASLQGTLRTQLRNGAVSHLGVELAGLDLAQGLGMLFKGDDALPVQCAVADLVATGGVFRPKVMVVDTADSALWVDGSLSLAREAMDLRLVVVPKDFSPLTLRTPLKVQGTFAKPALSLEKGPLGTKIGAAVLLGLVNPLAALLPFIDIGNDAEAQRGAVGCQALQQRGLKGR